MKPHDERLLVSPFVVNSEEYNENQDVAPLQSALQHLVTNVSFDALGSKRVVEASQNVMDAAEHERLVNHQAVLQKIRSEEHTSELQSLMRNSYAVFCLKKKKKH